MLYPDGSSVQAGDLIWWDEGHCVGFVQEVIETEAELFQWGVTHPHLSIGGHPYRPGAPGFLVCPASEFADDGVGRLTDEDRTSLNRAIEHALGQAKVDLSTVDMVVQTEASDNVQTAWLITVNPTGEESVIIRVPVD